MLITCNVIKLDKSNEIKDVHPWNIYFIFVTFEVSNEFRFT